MVMILKRSHSDVGFGFHDPEAITGFELMSSIVLHFSPGTTTNTMSPFSVLRLILFTPLNPEEGNKFMKP